MMSFTTKVGFKDIYSCFLQKYFVGSTVCINVCTYNFFISTKTYGLIILMSNELTFPWFIAIIIPNFLFYSMVTRIGGNYSSTYVKKQTCIVGSQFYWISHCGEVRIYYHKKNRIDGTINYLHRYVAQSCA